MIIDDWKSIAMRRTRLGVFLLNCEVVLCRVIPQEQGINEIRTPEAEAEGVLIQ
jgi:hypothetical protein